MAIISAARSIRNDERLAPANAVNNNGGLTENVGATVHRSNVRLELAVNNTQASALSAGRNSGRSVDNSYLDLMQDPRSAVFAEVTGGFNPGTLSLQPGDLFKMAANAGLAA